MYTNNMWNNARRYFIILLVIITQRGVICQNLPVVATYSLISNSVDVNIVKTVNDLIYSFINELRTYSPLDMRSDPVPEDFRVPDGTQYIFYGSLKNVPEGIKLELILKGGPFAVTRLISRVYENTNRILLESRILVQELFDQTVSLPDPVNIPETNIPSPPQNETTAKSQELIKVVNIDSLAGSWKAEEGIEKIMILRGGRGVAILTSGISISLELLLSNGDLVIRQKGMINPRQFMDLPDLVAKQAVNIAPPLEWHFSITSDQKMLSGIKKSVLIKNDGKNILSMENNFLQVNWIRD